MSTVSTGKGRTGQDSGVLSVSGTHRLFDETLVAIVTGSHKVLGES